MPKKKSDVRINSDDSSDIGARREGESTDDYVRRGLNEASGGRRYIADKESKDRRYASDTSYKGTKYSSDASRDSSKYSADRGYDSTKYSSDASERNSARSLQGSEYSADRGYEGTKYSSDASERSNKYSSDNSLKGTEYSADVSERNNRRDAGNTFMSNYAALSSQPKNYFQASQMLHNGISNGYGSFVDDARASTNQNQRGFVSYNGDFQGNKAQAMFSQGGNDEPYQRPYSDEEIDAMPPWLRRIVRRSPSQFDPRVVRPITLDDISRPFNQGGNDRTPSMTSTEGQDDYPRVYAPHGWVDESKGPMMGRTMGTGYLDEAPRGGRIIIVAPEGAAPYDSMPHDGIVRRVVPDVEQSYLPGGSRYTEPTRPSDQYDFDPTMVRYQRSMGSQEYTNPSRYGDSYDQGGDFGGGGNDTGSRPWDSSAKETPQIQTMQTAPSVYRQQSVAAPSAFAALPAPTGGQPDISGYERPPAPSQQQGQGYPDVSYGRPSSGRYQAMSGGYGNGGGSDGGSSYGSKPRAYHSTGGGRYHTMSNDASNGGYGGVRPPQYSLSTNYAQGGDDFDEGPIEEITPIRRPEMDDDVPGTHWVMTTDPMTGRHIPMRVESSTGQQVLDRPPNPQLARPGDTYVTLQMEPTTGQRFPVRFDAATGRQVLWTDPTNPSSEESRPITRHVIITDADRANGIRGYAQGGDTQYSGQWQGNGGGDDGSGSRTDWASQDTWKDDQAQLAKMDDAFRPGVGKWKAGYWEGLNDDEKDLWRSYWANRGISAKGAEHDYASSRTGNADYFGAGRAV